MKQTIQLFTDDLDGSDATQTITFAVDGGTYQIDLSDANAAKLRMALEEFKSNGRRIAGAKLPRSVWHPAPPKHQAAKPINGKQPKLSGPKTDHWLGTAEADRDRSERMKIRDWAREEGYKVAARGSIAQYIVDAYHKRDMAQRAAVVDTKAVTAIIQKKTAAAKKATRKPRPAVTAPLLNFSAS